MTEKQLSDREIKALQIAAKSKLTQKGNVWLVPSQAGHGEYEVRPDPQAPRCTCPDYEFRNARCKHIVAVEYVMMRETTVIQSVHELGIETNFEAGMELASAGTR